MRFELTYKPELIASKDETRTHMCHVELDVAGKRMMATDGHRAVIVPCVPDANDHSGPITGEALKAARKAHKRLEAAEINANGALVVPLAATYPRPSVDAPFPPLDKVVPTVASLETAVTIGLNAKYLYELAQALGSINDSVKITFDAADPLKPILVHGCSSFGRETQCNTEAIGVLMPVRV